MLRRTPDKAGKIGFRSTFSAGFERPHAWRLLYLEQQVYAAVRRGQCRLSRPARRQETRKALPQPADSGKQWRLEHQALHDVDQIVAEALTKPDPQKGIWLARSQNADPKPEGDRRSTIVDSRNRRKSRLVQFVCLPRPFAHHCVLRVAGKARIVRANVAVRREAATAHHNRERQ